MKNNAMIDLNTTGLVSRTGRSSNFLLKTCIIYKRFFQKKV